MNYQVFIATSAAKDLERIPFSNRNQILKKVISLKNNPRPPGVKKMKGFANRWRIRVGDYRVIYEIEDDPADYTGYTDFPSK